MQNFMNNKWAKISAGVIAFALLMTIMVSCSRPAYNPGYAGIPVAQPQYAPQVVPQAAPAVTAPPAPVVVQGGSGHSMSDTIIGTAVGSTIGTALGNHLSRDRTTQPTYAPPAYQRPVQPAYVAPAQRYVPPPQAARPVIRAQPSTRTSIRIGKTR